MFTALNILLIATILFLYFVFEHALEQEKKLNDELKKIEVDLSGCDPEWEAESKQLEGLE